MEIETQTIGPRHGKEPEVIQYLTNHGTAISRMMTVKETFGLRYELDGVYYTDRIRVGEPVRVWRGTPALSEVTPLQITFDTFHYTWVIFALPSGNGFSHLYITTENTFKQIRNQSDGGDGFSREDEPGCPGSGEPVFLPLEVIALHRNLRYQIDLNDAPILRPQRHVYLLTGLRKAFPDTSDPPLISYQGQYGYELNPKLEYPEHIWSQQPYDNDPIGATHFMVAVPQMRIAVSPYNATLVIAQDGTVWFTSPGQNGTKYSTQVALPTNVVTNQSEIIAIAVGWNRNSSSWVMTLEATDKHVSINGHDSAWLHRKVITGLSTSTNPILVSNWSFAIQTSNDFTSGIASLETTVDWLSGTDFYNIIDNQYFPRSFDLITSGVPTQWSMPTFDIGGYMDGWNQASMYIMMPDGTEITTERQVIEHNLTTTDATPYYTESRGPNGFDLWQTTLFSSWYLLEVWIDYDGNITTRLVDQDSSTFINNPYYDPSRGTWGYIPLPPLTGLMIGRVLIYGQNFWGQTLIGHDISHTTFPWVPPSISFYAQAGRSGIPTATIPNYFWDNMPDGNSLAFGYWDNVRPFPIPNIHDAVAIPRWPLDFEAGGGLANAQVRTPLIDFKLSIGPEIFIEMANGYMPGSDMGAPGGPLAGYPVPFDYGHQVHGWWISNTSGYAIAGPNIGGWATTDINDAYDVAPLLINSDAYNSLKASLITWDMPNYTRNFNSRAWKTDVGARLLYQPVGTLQSISDNYGGYIPVDPALFPGWETYTNPCRPINNFGFQQIPSVIDIDTWSSGHGGNPRQYQDPVRWLQDSITFWNNSNNDLYARVKSQSQFSYDLTYYRSPKMTFIPNSILQGIFCYVTFDGQLVYDIINKKWRAQNFEFDVITTNILAQKLNTPRTPVNIVEVRQQGTDQPVLAADTILWYAQVPVLHNEYFFTQCVSGVGSTASVLYCTEATNGDLMSYSAGNTIENIYVVPTGTLLPGTFFTKVGTTTIRTVRIVITNFPFNVPPLHDTIHDFVTIFSFSLLWHNFVPIGDEIVNLTYESGSPHDSIIAIHGSKNHYSVQKYTNGTTALLDGLPDLFPFPTNEDFNIFRFTSAGYTDIITAPIFNPAHDPSLIASLVRSNSATHSTLSVV